jgi:L-lactate dehydrogenase
MSVVENTKLAIIGAGSVGSSLAYASLIRNSAREVALYDVNTAKAEAEVLDLAHGTPFTGASRITGGGDMDVIAGANVVVITAGAKQEPGQTRIDLAGTNARILEKIMPQLVERAPKAVYILVTNPCDVLTVIAQQISGLPAGKVFSSGTVLDSGRLRWLLAERAGVAAQSVHASIVGEHGDSEFPLWSQASIGLTPLREWTDASGAQVFTRDVLDAGRDELRDRAVGRAHRRVGLARRAGRLAGQFGAVGLSRDRWRGAERAVDRGFTRCRACARCAHG